MADPDEVSRLLDILGNRNRRRIIELLRQKPCFVTEISEILMISPKAVIDHLQLMERASILSCQTDERRRKYYFLANDIMVDVSLRQSRSIARAETERDTTRDSVRTFGEMIRSHDLLLSRLEEINHEIERTIHDLARNHKDLITSDREITVLIALSHQPLSREELGQVTMLPSDDLDEILARFARTGILGRTKDLYTLRGIHAE